MFLKKRFFLLAFLVAAISVVGVGVPVFYTLAKIAAWALFVCLFADIIVLCFVKVSGERIMSQKLDLGESNPVGLRIKVKRGLLNSHYAIDELPFQFRTSTEKIVLQSNGEGEIVGGYEFRPVERGAYKMGRLLLFGSFFGLAERRFIVEKEGVAVDVYPAFSHLREKEQQARSLQREMIGQHKRQLPSNQTEFRDIREYVIGDDIRTVNWKATARVDRTMVNNYEDERSQHIYNIIDCGRTMHRTFDGLTLQDYAVNASLLLSYSALHTESDNVGLFTYGPSGIDYLPSRGGEMQLKSIMHHLYATKTEYGEGDLEELCLLLDRRIQRRSLIVLYTDYATLPSLDRQIGFLRRISRRHCLVVVMFQDKAVESLSERKFGAFETNKVGEYNENGEKSAKIASTRYVERSIASDLVQQKLVIADKLQQNGIHCLMTYPENLSFAVVQKYIELKAKRAW